MSHSPTPESDPVVLISTTFNCIGVLNAILSLWPMKHLGQLRMSAARRRKCNDVTVLPRLRWATKVLSVPGVS